MSENTIYTLVPSTTRGRYALDDPEHGHDLTSGEPIAIRLGWRWIEGRVEGSHVSSTRLVAGTYVAEHARTADLPLIGGYYFIATDKFICGLCVGMKVKLL